MGEYFSLFVAGAYLVMTIVFLAAMALHVFSLPVKLRIHAPLVDGTSEGKERENHDPEKKKGVKLMSAENKPAK